MQGARIRAGTSSGTAIICEICGSFLTGPRYCPGRPPWGLPYWSAISVKARRGAAALSRPVSPPRSSNRTGGFPASGFPTGVTSGSRHNTTPSAMAQSRHTELAEHRLHRERPDRTSPRPHLGRRRWRGPSYTHGAECPLAKPCRSECSAGSQARSSPYRRVSSAKYRIASGVRRLIANHLTSFASKTSQKSGAFPPPA